MDNLNEQDEMSIMEVDFKDLHVEVVNSESVRLEDEADIILMDEGKSAMIVISREYLAEIISSTERAHDGWFRAGLMIGSLATGVLATLKADHGYQV